MSEWINVKDKLPEEFEDVLIRAIDNYGTTKITGGYADITPLGYAPMWYVTVPFIHLYENDIEIKINDNHILINEKIENVTHWMRLPEPPKD